LFLLFLPYLRQQRFAALKIRMKRALSKTLAGRVKYTVHKTGNREIIKDSKGRITGTTRETKERKYYYNSNGSSAGTETKREPASRQRKSHHTASPESNDRK